MPGCRRGLPAAQDMQLPRTEGKTPRHKNADACTLFSLEKSREETRLAGHCRAIVWIREKHALLCGEPLRQNSNVRNGPRRCGHPRGMNQRKRQHLRKDRLVIRMPDVAKRSRRYHAETRRIHYLNIPMFAQCSNHPPANGFGREENCKHRRRPPEDVGTPKENHFQGRAKQHGDVQQHHPAEPRLVDFGGPTRAHCPLVPLRNAQLGQPQQRHGKKQSKKGNDAHVHCSSRNSALKPGPNAAAIAYSPAWSGLFSSHSCRMKRMVALERFPKLARMSQEGCVSHLHKPSSASMFPSSRAPPGCRIQPLMSSLLRPCRSRKPRTSPPIFPPIISGTSLASRMWKRESRRSNPMAPSESGKV